MRSIYGSIVLAWVATTTQAGAEVWKRVKADRFGASISLPVDVFEKSSAAASNNDGLKFYTNDKSAIIIIGGGFIVEGNLEFADHAESVTKRTQSQGARVSITRDDHNALMFTVEQNDFISYHKHIPACGNAFNYVMIKFPAKRKDTFESISSAVVASLQNEGGYDCQNEQ